jgi:Asp-tRNA(Asn)/Glu-tRNA(Gln) amidotransferase A subunit family amidase
MEDHMAELGLLTDNIWELAPKIRRREVSPVEVAQAAIAHAERIQPHLNGFITLLPERALRQAQELGRELARGQYRGPLHSPAPWSSAKFFGTPEILGQP